MSDSVLWHPNAKRVIIPTAPQDLTFTGGGKKLVWHTTEGSTVEGAESAYRANRDCPHFTIALVNGKRVLHQHLPLNRAASALEHPQLTPETNRANCWQVEIAGDAAQSGDWPKQKYHYLHLLAKWIHKHAGVPMTEGVAWQHPERMGGTEFVNYSGHCGHVHAANNHHTDPGPGFHIGYVLKGVK